MLTILRHRDLRAELIVLPQIDSSGAHRRELAATAREAIAGALGAPLQALQPG
jgi:1-acyl-sn-glycerol-3-phosphate acyltransferase